MTSREIQIRKKKDDATSDQVSLKEEALESQQWNHENRKNMSSPPSSENEEIKERKGKKRARSQTYEREGDFSDEKEMLNEVSLYKTNSSLS